MSVFQIPNGCETLLSIQCLPLYPTRGWEPGVERAQLCGYEGLYTPLSQTSRWTCLSCCQKGHFVQGINSDAKGITGEFSRIRLTQLVLLLPETSNPAKILKRKIISHCLNSWRPSNLFAWDRNMQTWNKHTKKHVLGMLSSPPKGDSCQRPRLGFPTSSRSPVVL